MNKNKLKCKTLASLTWKKLAQKTPTPKPTNTTTLGADLRTGNSDRG